MKYKLGDQVQWASGSHGEVVFVIPAGCIPNPANYEKDFDVNLLLNVPSTHGRAGESYLVSVRVGNAGKPSLCWPKVEDISPYKPFLGGIVMSNATISSQPETIDNQPCSRCFSWDFEKSVTAENPRCPISGTGCARFIEGTPAYWRGRQMNENAKLLREKIEQDRIIDGLVNQLRHARNMIDHLKPRSGEKAISFSPSHAQTTDFIAKLDTVIAGLSQTPRVEVELLCPYIQTDDAGQKNCELAEVGLRILNTKLKKAEQTGKDWMHEFNTYRSAWIRELGGRVVNKTHEIDALVLTTRDVVTERNRLVAVRNAAVKLVNAVVPKSDEHKDDLVSLLQAVLDDYEKLKTAIKTHRDQKADDRCWMDDYALWATLPDTVPFDITMPPKDKFLENCARYYETRCREGNWPSYKELEEKISRLRSVLIQLGGHLAQAPNTFNPQWVKTLLESVGIDHRILANGGDWVTITRDDYQELATQVWDALTEASNLLRRHTPDYEVFATEIDDYKEKVVNGHIQLTKKTIEARRTGEVPLDIILFCPKCHKQHIDAPDERTPLWTNPPHKKHLCHYCGELFKPANVCTNGIARLVEIEPVLFAKLVRMPETDGWPSTADPLWSKAFGSQPLFRGEWPTIKGTPLDSREADELAQQDSTVRWFCGLEPKVLWYKCVKCEQERVSDKHPGAHLYGYCERCNAKGEWKLMKIQKAIPGAFWVHPQGEI